jgi:hypothetical protein
VNASIALELSSFFDDNSSAGAVVPIGTFASEFDVFFDDAKMEAAAVRRRNRAAAAGPFCPLADAEKKARRAVARAEKSASVAADKLERIAVLDMETDPFDTIARGRIAPFAACLYSANFKTIVIWEENEEKFIARVLEEINALPGSYTIYAHNGGRFDFLFLIHRLRGPVSFKGRGIMSTKIGAHELRDSHHIIPEKLAAYRKDDFDYSNMAKTKRWKFKQKITDYLISDCVYLYDIVVSFLKEYGFKISIGQAAMYMLKKEYPNCENVTGMTDEYLRNFFYGGRVECLGGAGDFSGEYKLYDVNSMYPAVMCDYKHPIGAEYFSRTGKPSEKTVFIDVTCFSKGAFPVKRENLGTCFPHEYGRFKISIHEYNMALQLGLISRVKINYCVDNNLLSTFENFIRPIYNRRLETKETLGALAKLGADNENYLETKKLDIFLKLLMNNSYGKFAQNPRRFKEYYLTDPDAVPDIEPETYGDFPEHLLREYAIWSRPIKKFRFNNVGTAASITGAARSVLMRAMACAIEPLYCDTDSLICRELPDHDLHKSRLGAWDLEAEISRLIVAGKKLYCYEKTDSKRVIKSKGVSGITWENMETLAAGGELVVAAFAPTITKTGSQAYIDRTIKATTARKAI